MRIEARSGAINVVRLQEVGCICLETLYRDHVPPLQLMGEFTTPTRTPIIVRPFIPPL